MSVKVQRKEEIRPSRPGDSASFLVINYPTDSDHLLEKRHQGIPRVIMGAIALTCPPACRK